MQRLKTACSTGEWRRQVHRRSYARSEKIMLRGGLREERKAKRLVMAASLSERITHQTSSAQINKRGLPTNISLEV